MINNIETGNLWYNKLLFWIFSLSIISISIVTPKFIDYYYTYAIVHKYGVKHFILTQYRWNDGRAISLPGLIRENLIMWLPHAAVIAIFAATLIILVYIYNKFLEKSLSIRFTYFSLITTLFIFFYGFYAHIAHSLYWGVGGGYMFGLLFNCLWFYFLLGLHKNDNLLSKKSIIFILLSGVVGGIGQNLFPSIFIYYLYILVFKKSTFNLYALFFSFITFAIGALIISVAKGNTAHASLIFHTTIFSTLSELPLNYFKVLGSYLSISVVIILLSIFLGIYHGIINAKFYEDKKEKKHHIIWLLMALTTVAPMSLIPVAASPRTSIFFQFFISIFFHNISYQLVVAKCKKSEVNFSFAKLFPTISVLFLLVHSFFIFMQWKYGLIAIKNEQDNDTAIRSEIREGKKVVELKEAITKKNSMAFCINYTEDPISKDPTFWVNGQLAEYYGVDSIKAK